MCCETGFLGERIDPVFEDRELFADALTSYYTDWEPESAFVVTDEDGGLCGYLLGCRHRARYALHSALQAPWLVLRALIRLPRYRPASRRFLGWILGKAGREVPPAPSNIPHFHVNLLPHARSVATTRGLIDVFLDHLVVHGERAVYGQVVTFSGRRMEGLFERYGFRVVNRSEITKYRELHPNPVYLCTVVKDLQAGARLYGS